MNSISAKEFLITTVLVSAFVGLSYGLQCYYCEPLDYGCDNPVNKSRGSVDCNQISVQKNDNVMSRILDQQRKRVDSVSYLCASFKVVNETDKNSTGIYRSCLVDTTTSNQCDLMKEAFADEKIGHLVDCRTCNESVCNNWTIDAFKNSSPESFTAVLLYTFLSSFFVAYVI